MTALDRLKAKRVEAIALTATIDRMALEHALREDVGDEVWAELNVTYSDNGHSAFIDAQGHAKVRAFMNIYEDGIGWYLTYVVGDASEMRWLNDFVDAMKAASLKSD